MTETGGMSSEFMDNMESVLGLFMDGSHVSILSPRYLQLVSSVALDAGGFQSDVGCFLYYKTFI